MRCHPEDKLLARKSQASFAMSNRPEQTQLLSTALMYWCFPLFSACLRERDTDMWLKQNQLQHSESAIRTNCSPTWLRALTGTWFWECFPAASVTAERGCLIGPSAWFLWKPVIAAPDSRQIPAWATEGPGHATYSLTSWWEGKTPPHTCSLL